MHSWESMKVRAQISTILTKLDVVACSFPSSISAVSWQRGVRNKEIPTRSRGRYPGLFGNKHETCVKQSGTLTSMYVLQRRNVHIHTNIYKMTTSKSLILKSQFYLINLTWTLFYFLCVGSLSLCFIPELSLFLVKMTFRLSAIPWQDLGIVSFFIIKITHRLIIDP